MYKHKRAGIVLAGLGLVVGGGAQAEDGGWYFALSGGLTSTNTSRAEFDDGFVAINEAVLIGGSQRARNDGHGRRRVRGFDAG